MLRHCIVHCEKVRSSLLPFVLFAPQCSRIFLEEYFEWSLESSLTHKLFVVEQA